MSGTYLVCDQCGNYGPPASFFVKEGVRLCYQCADQEEQPQTHYSESLKMWTSQARKSPQDK